MNSKLKLTLGILGFVILLGGSAWLYHSLSGSFTPDNELSADKTSQTQTVNTENTATEQETDSAPSQTTEVLPAPDFSVTDYGWHYGRNFGDRGKLGRLPPDAGDSAGKPSDDFPASHGRG